jgi:hypothetical protein
MVGGTGIEPVALPCEAEGGGLAITWYEEPPARLPQVVARMPVGAAGASLLLRRTAPPLLRVAADMLGGYLVWVGWNRISQLTLMWLGRSSPERK